MRSRPLVTAALAALAIAGVAAQGGCRRQRAAPPTNLTILLGSDVTGLDPHTGGLSLQTQTALASMYDGLVEFDALMAMRPALAVAWTNPDELTWDFHLRGDVPFQTGGTVTPADVVYSITRARDHPRSALRSALSDVDEISVRDGDTVRIHTRRPNGHLVSQLRGVYIVSRDFVQQYGQERLAVASSGTGSYSLARRYPGASIDLEAFDGWRGAPFIQHVRLLVSCAPLQSAGRSGQPFQRLLCRTEPSGDCAPPADFPPRVVPGLAVWYLGYDLRDRASPGVTLPPGSTGNPFRDPRVRAAISTAIDRGKLARSAAFFGRAYPTGQLVPALIFGHDQSIVAQPQQLDAARALLASSAYPRGFTVRLDLRELSAHFAAPLVQDLGAIGITVVADPRPDVAFFQRMKSGSTSLYLRRYFCWTGDAQDALDYLVHSPDEARGLGSFNAASEVELIPGLDAEIEQAHYVFNAATRVVLLQSVLRRVAEHTLLTPLIHAPDIVVVSPDVDFSPRADGLLLARDARFTR